MTTTFKRSASWRKAGLVGVAGLVWAWLFCMSATAAGATPGGAEPGLGSDLFNPLAGVVDELGSPVAISAWLSRAWRVSPTSWR